MLGFQTEKWRCDIKFLYFYCSHVKGVNPISRKGSYIDDMIAKFKEIGEIVKTEQVENVIHGGDLFDGPSVSYNVCDAIVDEIESWGKPFYIIRGNHDEIGHNPKASGQSVLDHIFRRSKVVKHLGGQLFDNEKLFIEGFDYYHNIENDLKEKGLKCSTPHLDCKKIAIVHAFILERPFLSHVTHVCVKDIKTDFDLVLTAHVHPPIGTIMNGKVPFIGIGSLARKSITDADARPSVAIISNSEIKIVPLKSVRNKDEIFDMEKVDEMIAFENRVGDFIECLESVKFQGLKLKEVIEKLGKEKNAERKVIDVILESIGKFENEEVG